MLRIVYPGHIASSSLSRAYAWDYLHPKRQDGGPGCDTSEHPRHGRAARVATLERRWSCRTVAHSASRSSLGSGGRRHKAALRSRATRDCLDHRRTLVSRARSCSSASPTSNRPSSPCLTSSATRAPASSPTLNSKSDAGKAVLTICANGRAVTRRSYLRGGEAALPQDLLTDGRPDPAQSRALGAAQSTALASRQVPASLNAPPSISPCDARSHALSELPDWRSTDVS